MPGTCLPSYLAHGKKMALQQGLFAFMTKRKKITPLMKWFGLSWLLFLLGVIFLFFHVPNNLLMVLSASVILVILSLTELYRHGREAWAISLIFFSFALISLYVTGRLHFWFISKILFIFTAIISGFTLLFYFIFLRRAGWQGILLFSCFLFTIWLSNLPSHRIFYAIRLNTMLNRESRATDYRSWDKYSWFLFIRDNRYAALEANKKAKEAAEKVLSLSPDQKAMRYRKLISQHEFQILHRNWESYP